MATSSRPNQYRRAHDPYNSMEEAKTRPDFVRTALKNAENNALLPQKSAENSNKKTATTQKRAQNSRLADSLRSLEKNQESRPFLNSVRGLPRQSTKQGSSGKKSFLKKLAPTTFIAALILGGGALFFSAQTLLGPHLSALYTKATDLQYTSYSLRVPRLMQYMLKGSASTDDSFLSSYSNLSPYMKKRLSKNGIEVGYLDTDGNFNVGEADAKTVLRYDNEIIESDSFLDVFNKNSNFREAYYKAKRGRLAGFFDDVSSFFYKNKGATRDIFDQYKSTGDQDKDLSNFEKTVTDRVTGTDTDINTVRHDVDQKTGEDTIVDNGEKLSSKSVSGNTPESKARAFVSGISNRVSSVGVPTCLALRVANIAAVAVASYQIFQSMAYFLSFMEPISKTMSGEGDAAAINETLNFLTKESTSTVSYIDDDNNVKDKTVTGSPLQSSGAKLVLGNTRVSATETAPYSLDNINLIALAIIGTTGASTAACSGITASSAIVSLASLAIPGGKLATTLVGAVAQTVGNIIISGVIATVISAIIPQVAKIFTSNVFETYTGIPAGELFSAGAATANFSLATQASAYMPSSKDAIKDQNHQLAYALADEALLDRQGRSPFDTSSENTFLGSLLTQFSYLSNSNSITNSLSSFANIFQKSLTKLSPSASAADEELLYTSNYTQCRNLSDTVCDIYGLPIVSSDYSTIDLSPDDPTYQAIILPNLENDKKTIKKNSELAKFITACTNRESPWGVLDANILNALQTDFGVIGNNAFIINDIADVVNAAEDIANQAWATGENCRNSSENPRWDTEFKYYQLYIEDMRLLSSMDDESENPVLSYNEAYLEEHPVDRSFTGTLARVSGLKKEDVAFFLEVIRYLNEIASYQTNDLFDFNQKVAENIPNFNQTSYPSEETIVVFSPITIIDKRNCIL